VSRDTCVKNAVHSGKSALLRQVVYRSIFLFFLYLLYLVLPKSLLKCNDKLRKSDYLELCS